MISGITWYDVLGVLPDAPPEDIRAAWQARKAALQPAALREACQNRGGDSCFAGLFGCQQAVILVSQGKHFVEAGLHSPILARFGHRVNIFT